MDIKINVLNKDTIIPAELVSAADGSELLARIFYNRGYRDAETVRQMMHEELYTPTGLEEFAGMEAAVERIAAAIAAGEPIAVYGDYDVDGVTSTATLIQCLSLFTSRLTYHVPDRFTEGYGMNMDVIRGLAHKGIKLIITCDCGISNVNEVKLARELGMDVIVTDHHTPPDELPPANVLLNPKLLAAGHKARNLSGCAMAYFLCLALLKHYGHEDKGGELLDLLALSLVADVVSLNGENRYLLKKALPRLFNTGRIGLRELFSIIEQNAALRTEEDIAFQIAPRINAAGRMDSARLPVELLLSGDRQEAAALAQQIDLLNRERKRVQEDIIRQAKALVETQKINKTVLVLFSEHWHHGIIGIAAGKICETYRRPAILLSMKEDGSTVVGSARSVEEINIYELIKECSKRLLKFGGHSAAAGLSLRREELEAFTREIEQLAEKKFFIREQVLAEVDLEMPVHKVNEELYELLGKAGPYGEGFEAPVFAARRVTAVSDRKTEKNHHILVLEDPDGQRLPAVKWFGGSDSYQGKLYDITYKIGKNTYRGNSELQLTLEHLSEAAGIPAKAFTGRITDARTIAAVNLTAKYRDAVFFYEGLHSACPVKDTIDRTAAVQAPCLVLLSTPANSFVFREMVSMVRPGQIILNFTCNPDYSFKGFILNLMGMIKHLTAQGSGWVPVEWMASRLCVEEQIVKSALNYLQEAGKVEYYLDDYEIRTTLRPVNRTPGDDHVMAERHLKGALLEKSAYQQFLLRLEAERFKEYLK
jgi:single-stranded-DNA-specific exonuclease